MNWKDSHHCPSLSSLGITGAIPFQVPPMSYTKGVRAELSLQSLEAKKDKPKASNLIGPLLPLGKPPTWELLLPRCSLGGSVPTYDSKVVVAGLPVRKKKAIKRKDITQGNRANALSPNTGLPVIQSL